MTTSERRDGKTPSGGAYSIIFYLDKDRNAVDKELAEVYMICEYDKNDELIFETIGLRD